MPGREGGGHVPSSLAQNWLRGEEPAAPSAEWEFAKRPGESALENLCCPRPGPSRHPLLQVFQGSQPSHPGCFLDWFQGPWLLSSERNPSPRPGELGTALEHLLTQHLLLSSHPLCQKG